MTKTKKIKIRVGETEREYIAFIANMTVSRVKAKGREYPLYRVTVPKDVARELARMANLPEDVPIPLIVLATPAEPYHIIDIELYDEDRPEVMRVKKELEALGLVVEHEHKGG